MGIFSSCSFPRISEASAPARRGSQGKGAASPRPSVKSDKGKAVAASVKTPHRLSQVEIQERQDAPLKSETLLYSGMKIKYGYVSQRGYYPDTPNKENQDSFLVVPSFDIQAKDTPKATAAFFGVFDGHGKDGHLCSRYVKQKVSSYLYLTVINMTSCAPYRKILLCLTLFAAFFKPRCEARGDWRRYRESK
jgi:hypothetical protein